MQRDDGHRLELGEGTFRGVLLGPSFGERFANVGELLTAGGDGGDQALHLPLCGRQALPETRFVPAAVGGAACIFSVVLAHEDLDQRRVEHPLA
ncbi:hypothetical protein [Sphingomonas yabuuchiae]|uniref:hypothetical protein n=1 Tax=Sphingomonas yabuuchiae TaxID=172044 RepID=UPI001F092ECD|nr:hypothetical protein [Sphingomonas yabuuchiae]